MKLLIPLLIVLSNPPLQGYVSNPPLLCRQHPALDKRGKPLIGRLSHTNLRGLIGCTYNQSSGQLTYIYPDSDLNNYQIKAGDYIVGIEKELYRPCLMTNVVIYPSGYILNLVIRTSGGKIRTIPVKLIDYRKFTSGDS